MSYYAWIGTIASASNVKGANTNGLPMFADGLIYGPPGSAAKVGTKYSPDIKWNDDMLTDENFPGGLCSFDSDCSGIEEFSCALYKWGKVETKICVLSAMCGV